MGIEDGAPPYPPEQRTRYSQRRALDLREAHRVGTPGRSLSTSPTRSTNWAGSADRDALIAGFDAAVEAVDATDVDGPNETTSKDLTYITGSRLTEGDVETALARAISGLHALGMEIGDPTSVEQGAVVAAHDDTIAVRIAVFAQAGLIEAPEGMSVVQIGVASVDAGLAWAPE